MTMQEEVEQILHAAHMNWHGGLKDDGFNKLVQAIRLAASPKELECDILDRHIEMAIKQLRKDWAEPRIKPPAPIGAIPTNPKDWDKEDWIILYNGIEDIRRKINERHSPGICPTCGGEGGVDSGGNTPWGSRIYLPCPSCSQTENKTTK